MFFRAEIFRAFHSQIDLFVVKSHAEISSFDLLVYIKTETKISIKCL